ncbi:AmmeMemoRadiSam system protein B [Anaerolineales bacterium HSG25]|nr:AmmeMemoRadiSam system protein B [Anaerolineales bacterium HSG25]
MSYLNKPKVMVGNVQRAVHEGMPVFILQDPLQINDAVILLPQALGPLVMLCDGQHTVPEIKQELKQNYGINLPNGTVDYLLSQLDEALMIEGGKLKQAKQKIMADYHTAPYRKSSLAGHSYPADADALRQILQGYVDELDDVTPLSGNVRALLSPHIDYQRGGPVYAGLWTSAAQAVREAELVIVLATDHSGGLGRITLTPQNYATPLGVLPTEQRIVNRLATALGSDEVYAEELHHINEWSIELVLVWLQYIRQGHPCPIVPILCGSFQHFMLDQANIQAEQKFQTMSEILREEMAQRRTLIVASGDLAHMGPAFDGEPLDKTDYTQMQVDDTILTNTLATGQAQSFFELMKTEQHERNVCGLSPFYFTLDLLQKSQGTLTSYDRCPADDHNTSFVSVCGMALE